MLRRDERYQAKDLKKTGVHQAVGETTESSHDGTDKTAGGKDSLRTSVSGNAINFGVRL